MSAIDTIRETLACPNADAPMHSGCSWCAGVEVARAALADLEALVKAAGVADRRASTAHDAMWAMNFDKTSAGHLEREEWKRQRKAASDALWKVHDALRPALARVEGEQPDGV